MKKFFKVFVSLIMVCLIVTGCGVDYELDSEAESLFVAYCANQVLQFDANYYDRLIEVTTTTTDEETETSEDETETTTTGSSTDSTGSGEGIYSFDTFVSLDDALSIGGFEFEITGYGIEDRVTFDGGAMSSADGKDLLVLYVDVTNQLAESSNLNMLDSDITFSAVVNNSSKLNVQIWLNNVTLNVFKGDFASGETKELMLVFQVTEGTDVSDIVLCVTKSSVTQYVNIL